MADEPSTPDLPQDPKPPNTIVPGAKLAAVNYMLGWVFHPPIKLDRKKGFEFAAELSEYIDPQNAQLGDQMWFFGQQVGESAAGGLTLAISPQQVQISFTQVSHRLEWIEGQCRHVFKAFEERFKPQLLLNSAATYDGILPVDGDARIFLASGIMHVPPERLNTLKRPLQMLGVRFVMPAYAPPPETKPGSKRPTKPPEVEWGVEVKAESLMDDPTKLLIHATANWVKPTQWSDESIENIIGHLKTISDYAQNDVMKLLESTPEEEQS